MPGRKRQSVVARERNRSFSPKPGLDRDVGDMNAGIRLLGTSHVEKTTDGTRRTTLRENPDVEWGGSKELTKLRIQCTTHMNETRPHMVPVRKDSAQLILAVCWPGTALASP
jgi:hypothetical protein